jgi:predicted PurR-regulated permease PerM
MTSARSRADGPLRAAEAAEGAQVNTGTRGAGQDRTVIIGGAIEATARWSLRLLLIAAAAYLLSYVIGAAWSVLLPILLALLLASMIAPLVGLLVERGVGRTLAAAVVVVASLLALAGILTLVARSVAGQIGEVADEATGGLDKVRDWVTGPPLQVSESQVNDAVEAVSSRLQDAASTIASGVFSGIGAVGSLLITAVLVVVLTFFFTKDGYRFLPWVRRFSGERAGRHLSEVFGRWWVVLGAYIRTQLIVSLVDAVLIGIGLVVIGVPLAATLAALTFLGGFIPIVGAVVAGGVAVLVALVTGGLTDALLVVGLVLLVQQLEGNVLSPWLQGKSLNLHAAVVILAVTGGGTRYGIIGAFLAVPVVACVAVLMRYLSEQVDDATDPAVVGGVDAEAAGDPPDEPRGGASVARPSPA